MKNTMTRRILIGCIAVSGLAFGLSSTASAGGHGYGHGWNHDPGYVCGKGDGQNWQERVETRQKAMRDALKLNANQENAWKTFTEKMTPASNELGNTKYPDPETFSKLSTPERMEKMLQFSKERQEFMAKRLEALKTFYAVLTPEQQKTFDEFHGPKDRKSHRNFRKQGGK